MKEQRVSPSIIAAIELERRYAFNKHPLSPELTILEWSGVVRYLTIKLMLAPTDEDRKHLMRKIAATCVSSMEQHGCIPREPFTDVTDE